MKKIIFTLLIATCTFLSGYLLAIFLHKIPYKDIIVQKTKIDKPLEKYSIDNLSNAQFPTGSYKESLMPEENKSFTSRLFIFRFLPEISGNNFKSTSGVVNIPLSENANKFPLVILIRGYVDQKSYISGTGTKNMAKYLAENGFVTIAPDFLGYGNSDSEAGNIFESRFQTYTTILSLIKSIENGMLNQYWDGKNLFIWAHSNGGQIALTTLEASGKNYPTVLWAPVSKPFPYSVLYYTYESDDHGKLIRSELSKFEDLYDAEKYSLTNYLDKINAPIQLHQGASDDAVPLSWSNSLYSQLKNLDKNVEYIKHVGADHNLNPDWNTAAQQSLKFYKDSIIQ